MSSDLQSLLTTQGSGAPAQNHDEHVDDVYAMPLADIQLRPNGNRRPLDLKEMLDRAESIDAVGLIEPIVVDKEAKLIAGLHRYESFRVLNLESYEERLAHLETLAIEVGMKVNQEMKDKLKAIGKGFSKYHSNGIIPTYIRKDLDWSKNKKSCESVEGAENHQRHNKTDLSPVFKTIENLMGRGYEVVGRGKPKNGQKSLSQGLVQAYGCTDRQALRWAKQFEKKKEDPKSTMSIKERNPSDVKKEDIQEFQNKYCPNPIDDSSLNEDLARAGLIVLNKKIKQLKSFLVVARKERENLASDK
jgi:hypothetical protein